MSDQKPKDVLAMPGYGEQTAGAARGFYCASLAGLDVDRVYNEGSLLAQNFNSLWCMALNKAHNGERIDYFAMQHADIEPEPGWLDSMIAELDAKHLDVLGAVVPIKCEAGLTSIALERADGNNWRPQCRLTMQEVYQLPETFTAADVGLPLLLNTGLWVAKFDFSWAKQVHFEINDRIVFNRRTNKFCAEVEPEDWFASRQFNDLGLKIGATRKIALHHSGKQSFSNEFAWGNQAFDSEFVPESIIPLRDKVADGFRFPFDVVGWLTQAEGEALAELARGKRVLEIGSYFGRSTICMAQTAERVTAIDYWDGRGTPVPQDTLPKFKENLARYGVAHKVDAVTPDKAHNRHSFDFIFIDGAHDLGSVQNDIAYAQQLLAPGGLIGFHDYNGRHDPEVTQAVNEFLSAGAELLTTHDSLAVVKPPAANLLEV